MFSFIHFIGPEQNVNVFGINMVGLDAKNLHRFLITLVYLAVLWLTSSGLRWLIRRLPKQYIPVRVFWIRQAVNMATAFLTLIGLLSIWFDDPTRLATGIGLASAGLAFALQKFVTSIAGYYVILSTRTFSVGDRIRMGGVRGDVISLNFIQTTIMEMGQPPAVQDAGTSTWVESRQFTGRIVSVSNSNIFDDPVFNYTREFPFIWEEIHIPITYTADRVTAEQVMLTAATKNTIKIEELAQVDLDRLQVQFAIALTDLKPRVFYRLTDNWIELTVRFITSDHGIREMKDTMFREILLGFDKAGIGVASSTYDIVGLPPINVQMKP